MNKPTVTLVVKAKNEAANITACLESVAGFATEIIVVNDDSTDATADLARTAGAVVLDQKSTAGKINLLDKTGFLAARSEWILRLDADERLTAGLAEKLREAAATQNYNGVRFARKQILFGAWIRYGGWFESNQLRFFRADSWARDWDGAPHTQPTVAGEILTLPAREEWASVHFDYDSVAQFIDRTLRGYSQTEAVFARESGRRSSLWRLLFRPWRKFLGKYFIRQGFRDGWRGFVLAVLLGMYEFCIEAQLRDLERGDS